MGESVDLKIQAAETVLKRVRPEFYGEDLSELEMLLRSRDNVRVKSSPIVAAAICFYFFVLEDWRWGGGMLGVLIISTVVEHLYYRSQRKRFDMAIALFVAHSPRTLAEIRARVAAGETADASLASG